MGLSMLLLCWKSGIAVASLCSLALESCCVCVCVCGRHVGGVSDVQSKLKYPWQHFLVGRGESNGKRVLYGRHVGGVCGVQSMLRC
jgi:hypothetical protein